MATLLHAILLGREQAVYEFGIGLVALIEHEGLHVFWRRRQPCEVERDAPNQLGLARGWRRLEALLAQPVQHEAIDVVLDERVRANVRDGWSRERSVSPPRCAIALLRPLFVLSAKARCGKCGDGGREHDGRRRGHGGAA